MPVVGSRLKCERCRGDRPPRQISHECIQLYSGPDGERLCSKHFHEAWDEHLDELGAVFNGRTFVNDAPQARLGSVSNP